jgi:hypothetical protein
MAKKEKETVEEVQAEKVQPPAVLTEADKWLSATTAKADEIATQYKPHEITTAQGYKDAKQARAFLRKEIAAIEAERKDQTREIENTLARFKSGAKAAIARLLELDESYKDNLDAWDERCIAERKCTLAEEYASYAPDLAEPLEGQTEPLVPFSRLDAKYSADGKWYNRSTSEKAAIADMQKRVEKIAADDHTIDQLDMTDAERTELKAEYFATLDFAQSMSAATQRREARKRAEALEQERLARQAWEQEQAAQQQAAELEAVETALEPMPQTVAQPTPVEQAVPEPVAAPAEIASIFVLEVEVTPTQKQALISYLKAQGIHGRIKRS